MIIPELPYTITHQVTKNPEKTWILDIRRVDGTISVDYVKDKNGNDLNYSSQRLNDKYIITLDEQLLGTAQLSIS